MLYHGISLVSVFGLRGTLYIEKAENAEGVSVQTEGPYETKVTDDTWLRIYPEGQEPPIPRHFHTDLTAEGTDVGSVDVTATARFLTDSGPADPGPRRRARASTRVKATVRIMAPPGTKFQLISCYGQRKGPGGWRRMWGNSQFEIRTRR